MTSRSLYWNPSTLTLPLGGGLMRLFQVTDRRNVLANLSVVGLADQLTGGGTEDAARAWYEAAQPTVQLADATSFSLWDHVFRNPDNLDSSVGAADLATLPWPEAVELLLEHRIVTDCWPPPTDRNKRHFGDRFRGSFYEQVATEALFERTTPAEWWRRQKFEPDHRSTRPTPYRYIEEHFLERYFAEHLGQTDVLEIGCGTGYFTEKMARHARSVVGVDYNPDFVAIARQNWSAPNLDFQVGDILDLSRGAPAFAARAYDCVFLIDTFLFLFDACYQPLLYQHRDAVMANLRRLLKPDGLLLVMDPHPLWLTPWLGHPDAPFGILTEYRNRQFKVIPTLEEITGFLCAHGLRIHRVREPGISAEFRSVDPQGWAFMRETPQWWFFEIEQGRAATPSVAA